MLNLAHPQGPPPKGSGFVQAERLVHSGPLLDGRALGHLRSQVHRPSNRNPMSVVRLADQQVRDPASFASLKSSWWGCVPRYY